MGPRTLTSPSRPQSLDPLAKDLVNKTRRVMMCFGRFLSLRQGGSRRQSESPRCLITNFRSGIGPDQSEWLTLQSHVSVGLIQWDCPWGSVIKPRSRCAPVRAYFRTLTSTCRSKSIIVRFKKNRLLGLTQWLP